MAAVARTMKLATTQAAMKLVQRAVQAIHASVLTTVYSANAVLKLRRPVKGPGVGMRALFAAVTMAKKSVTAMKPAVRPAVCPLMKGIPVVGKSIALKELSVALERPDAVPMSGNAVGTLV
jgi:hypothetical protein